MDLTHIYANVTRDRVPQAVICYDPFHVIQLANRALDLVLSASRHGAVGTITLSAVEGVDSVEVGPPLTAGVDRAAESGSLP